MNIGIFDASDDLASYNMLELDALVYFPNTFDKDTFNSRLGYFDASTKNQATHLNQFLSNKSKTLLCITPRDNSESIYISNFLEKLQLDREFKWNYKTGNRISFHKTLNTIKENIHSYSSIALNPIGTPLATVENTGQILSFVFPYKSNAIIFLSFPGITYDDCELILKDFLSDFSKDLHNLVHTKTTLPEWTTSLLAPGEKEVVAKYSSLQNQREKYLQKIDKKIKGKEEQIQDLQNFKSLFASKGRRLENIVATIFKNIGFEVSSPNNNRVDHIISYDGKVAVLEVKGRDNRSAAESDAAQLEKWVSEHIREHSSKPKGILVVNAFANTSPLERESETFPDQMLEYSEKRNHCLISGLQLFNLYYTIQEKPDDKPRLINALFETDGRYEDVADEWIF